MFLILFLFINVKSVFATEKFFLSADTISKNENNNTIKAEGNVSITNNQYKLKANEMVYYLSKKKIFAKGNVNI